MKREIAKGRSLLLCLVGAALLSMAPLHAATAQDTGNLDARMERLEQQIEMLRSELEATKAEAQAAREEAQSATEEVAARTAAVVIEDKPLSKWHLAGYADTSFVAHDGTEPDTTFASGHFNPVLHFQYSDFLLFEGELEFEIDSAGATTTELEYAAIDFIVNDYLTVVAGKYLSPIGQFQERLHPSWINKLPDAPVGFGHGGVQPLSDVGLQLRGGVPIGSMIASYSAFVGNGPRVNHHEMELEGFGADDNDDKALGGRLSLLVLPYLEVGGSFMTAQVLGEAAPAGPVTEGDYLLWGVDAAFTRGAWDVRGEYLNAELDSFFGATSHGAATTSLIPKTNWNAWYVQAAYQLSGITDTPFLMNLEPVIRYGEFNVEGFDEFVEHAAPEQRWSIGVNYVFAPSVILKLGMSWRNFRDPDAADATEFRVQLAYGF